MEEPLEILFVAFCGVVLTFALIFVACWCVISCSFFCLKYVYCANLNKIVNAAGSDSNVSLDSESSGSERSFESIQSLDELFNPSHHRVGPVQIRGGQSYRGYEIAECHSGKLGNDKDVPPSYDCPPPYESLFPKDEEASSSDAAAVTIDINSNEDYKEVTLGLKQEAQNSSQDCSQILGREERNEGTIV